MSCERIKRLENGEITEKGMRFCRYLLEGIANYVEEFDTDRSELIFAIYEISKIVFCEQTHLDIGDQCKEIDVFCEMLKNYATRDSTKV